MFPNAPTIAIFTFVSSGEGNIDVGAWLSNSSSCPGRHQEHVKNTVDCRKSLGQGHGSRGWVCDVSVKMMWRAQASGL